MTKILIIVDMQNDFITGPLGNDDCRNAVKGCVELAKSDEFAYTIYTRDTHFEDYLETLEGKKLPVTHCIHETEGWELIPELAELQKNKHAFVVNKTTFGSTVRLNDVVNFLTQELKDDEFEIHFAGVCTSICVISNMAILRAWNPNTRIVLHKNATGDVTQEQKEAAFVVAKSIQCDVED